MDEIAKSMGFEDAAELHKLVASVPLWDARFEKWKHGDGTKAGLLALIEKTKKAWAIEDRLMHLYQLNIEPDLEGDVPEGKSLDEWFGSLKKAKARRRELIETSEPEPGGDWAIERIEFTKLPRRRLALAILNGTGYVTDRKVVVPEYFTPEEDDDDDEDED